MFLKDFRKVFLVGWCGVEVIFVDNFWMCGWCNEFFNGFKVFFGYVFLFINIEIC